MSKEYIEKEAAIQKFSEEIYAACGNAMANGLMYGRRLIDTIPAADVKPVVRCKECGYWDKSWEPSGDDVGCHFCTMTGMTTEENFFCAYGEFCPNCGAEMREEVNRDE